jgi:hypothetical protein
MLGAEPIGQRDDPLDIGAQRARDIEALPTRPSRTITQRSSPKHRGRSAGRNASGKLPGRALLELRHPETAPPHTQGKRRSELGVGACRFDARRSGVDRRSANAPAAGTHSRLDA